MSEAPSMITAVHAMAERLALAGFFTARRGGVSARSGRSIVIAAAGGGEGGAVPADATVVDLASGAFAGPRPAELELHLAIYRQRRDIGAVIRTSAPFTDAVASARRPLPPVLEELAQLAGPSVRVVDPAPPDAADTVRGALAALRGRRAALLARDGGMCLGRDLDEAFLCCQVLERGCQTFVEAQFLGGPKHLGLLEAHIFHQYYLRRYSRAWQRGDA